MVVRAQSELKDVYTSGATAPYAALDSRASEVWPMTLLPAGHPACESRPGRVNAVAARSGVRCGSSVALRVNGCRPNADRSGGIGAPIQLPVVLLEAGGSARSCWHFEKAYRDDFPEHRACQLPLLVLWRWG